MRKKLLVLLISSLITIGGTTLAFANEKMDNKFYMPTIEEQEKAFEEIENKLKTKELKVVQDKESNAEVPVTKFTTGTYPTRRGTFLVTDGLRVDSLVGHAGMVLGKDSYVESFPSGGVRYYSDNWTRRYKKVWGATTKGTSTFQDSKAGDWASSQYGKPYNRAFNDKETTSKFYCSQLVYKAFKTTTGVDLNHFGIVVTPADLINDADSSVIYTYKRYENNIIYDEKVK